MTVTQKTLLTETGVSLDRLVLITGQGNRIEMGLQLVELNLFEDIFSPHMTATVVFDDALNLIENLHLCGQEWLFIRVSKPGFESSKDEDDASFAILMRVYKVENVTPSSSFVQRYVMHLCKEEHIYGLQSRVARSFKLRTPEDAIYDIFKQNLFYEDETFKSEFEFFPMARSSTALSFVIPNMRTFEAVSYIATLARNDNHINDFLFYESNAGYRFESISRLMEATPTIQIRYRIKNVNDMSADPYINMFSPKRMYIDTLFDYMQSLVDGEFGVQSDYFDMSTQTFVSNPISYKKFLKDFKGDHTLNKYSKVPKNDWQELVGDNPTERIPYHRVFYPVTRSVALTAEAFRADGIATRLMQMSPFMNQKIRLHMSGSPFLRAGCTIQLDYPTIESHSTKHATADDLLDRYLAAKYLVTSVRHVITQREWHAYCEISKDTLPNEIPENFADNFTLEGL